MSKETLSTGNFYYVADLIKRLQEIQHITNVSEHSRRNVEIGVEDQNGKELNHFAVIETTLSDGRKVYDVRLY